MNNNNSRLIIVGKKKGISLYIKFLEEKIKFYKLTGHVIFADVVSNDELKTLYSISDIFVITSEHEGFCVPLIEAMSFKKTIVAYDSTAIPYTINNAGLV